MSAILLTVIIFSLQFCIVCDYMSTICSDPHVRWMQIRALPWLFVQPIVGAVDEELMAITDHACASVDCCGGVTFHHSTFPIARPFPGLLLKKLRRLVWKSHLIFLCLTEHFLLQDVCFVITAFSDSVQPISAHAWLFHFSSVICESVASIALVKSRICCNVMPESRRSLRRTFCD